MQWADVILALYYMGVDVTVHASYAKRSEEKADQVWLDYYSKLLKTVGFRFQS
jgi:hypothetical protein